MNDEIEPFYFNRINRASQFTMHTNNYFDSCYGFYYLVHGNRKFFIDKDIYLIEKGDFLLINKNTLHRSTYYEDGTHERIYIKFSDKMLAQLFTAFGKEGFQALFHSPHYKMPRKIRDLLVSYLEAIESEYAGQDLYSSFLIQGYLANLFITLIRYQQYASSKNLVLTKDEKTILTVVSYIHENYKNAPSLTEAANMIFVSPPHFSRLFKETTGFNFSIFVTNIKIEASTKLLIESEMSIQDIAEACGFSNSNYFCDVFKKVMGISPRGFRKKWE